MFRHGHWHTIFLACSSPLVMSIVSIDLTLKTITILWFLEQVSFFCPLYYQSVLLGTYFSTSGILFTGSLPLLLLPSSFMRWFLSKSLLLECAILNKFHNCGWNFVYMLFTIVVTHCPVVVLWYLNLKLVHSIKIWRLWIEKTACCSFRLNLNAFGLEYLLCSVISSSLACLNV